MNEATFDRPGLLVLTPPHNVDPAELDRIVARRHVVGPTMIVTPKWIGVPVRDQDGGRKGWVRLGGPVALDWPGFRDDISLAMRTDVPRWSAQDLQGPLPAPQSVQSGSGARLVPLVTASDGRVLAGYIDDGGIYPALEDIALGEPSGEDWNDTTYPLILVFEPDLFDNYGMADKANALLAGRLFGAAAEEGDGSIAFDLTLNGHARSANLLTLAFTPPFLAATLCLLIAALVAGWRAFLRFGPPLRQERAIAFGKRALVANTAGLIRRARRLHLLTGPYADAARERLCRALGVPRHLDARAGEDAIDRAMAAQGLDGPPFSALAQGLREAKRPHDIIGKAMTLHGLERTLTR